MAKKCKPKKSPNPKKREKYVCEVCGLVVRIDETCGCVEACDIICCGKEMKIKK